MNNAEAARADGHGEGPTPLNYFNYYTEVEDAFIRRRGKSLLISPLDWALIESWKEMGIPLHVVLRGVEKAFDSWESKPRKRSIKTLLYCQEEVEAQYAEWLESRVGAPTQGEGDGDAGPDAPHQSQPSDDQPFSRSAILEHLRTAHEKITSTAQHALRT